MGTPAPQVLRIGTRQTLDTANPESDRPPGTLVTARDLHHKWIGPRKGRRRIASAFDSDYTTMMLDGYITFNGTTTKGYSYIVSDEFRDLGTEWTVDLYFTLTETAYAAGNPIHLLSWYTSASVEAIRIAVDPSTLLPTATVKVTSSRGVVAGTGTITATAGYTVQVGSATTQSMRTHLRLVRNGRTYYWFVNGLAAGSGPAGIASSDGDYPCEGAYGTAGIVRIGDGSIAGGLAYFKGVPWFVVMRASAHTTVPIEAVPTTSLSGDVRYYLANTPAGLHAKSATASMYDMGPFHAHTAGTGGVAFSPHSRTPPGFVPIQGMGTVTARNGSVISSVMSGGILFSRYVS